ncbi:uncharacterized protein LOC117339168 isoform X2 [Pecten maximus]|uniref:uncharacterized protein LOC117339168 isoform X2 n=1 Tax=Pecten maximus TaxID=6579 RepID=UPI001458CA6A|nr:uncharacterized protein LOC117339168 isoform X2 [Pecten maximus]XP_033756499.1 uncharacterized protein LOC117339168 isoform X2 [Pecten maximus]
MAEADPRPEYRCLICTSLYKEPRLLPCGHTFCCRCLTSYIEAEYVTSDENRHFFPCPVCEAPITPDDVNTAVSTWATCFPESDFLVAPTAQPSDVHFCAPCQRGQESIPAEVTCTDCDEKLCKRCRIHHERSKASADHRLVSISGNVGQLCDEKVYEICHKHSGKPLDVYCVDHSAMCCSICVSVSHRQCNNVKPMEDVIKKTMAKQSPGETEWKELTEETKKMLDEDDLGITTLNAKEKEVSAEMTDRIQKAKDELDSLNARFQSDLADKCRTYRQQLSSRRNYVNTFNINAENSHLLMSRSDQQLSERHRFFVREQTKHQISGHYRRMDQNTKKEPNKFDITLKLETTIDEIMKMTTAGNVDVTSTLSPVSQNANDRIYSLIGTLLSTLSATTFDDSTSTSDLMGSLQHLTVQTTPVTTAVDVWTGSVSCVHTVNTSTLGGMNKPWLMGGIFTDNNELLITDYINRRLLLFDDNYSYLTEYKVNGKPTDIARGRTADEIFVAVDQKQILRCTLQNGQLSVINTISSPLNTWGIAVLGDNILVGTPDSVEVMSIDGKVTKSIKKGGLYTYLAVSTSTVYYRDNNDVVCRRLDSDAVVYRYRDRGLRDPVGIGLDRDNNVYVFGHMSNNIYLVSPDGSRGRVLLSELSGITRPWCIVVHPTKQEFVVTSYQGSTALKVYKFSDNSI